MASLGRGCFDTLDRRAERPLGEVERALEDSDFWRERSIDTDTSTVIRGVGIDVEGVEVIDLEAEEIRNDFLAHH